MRCSFNILILWLGCIAQLAAATFSNPIISSGADPWVIFKDGSYYYTQTTGGSVKVRRAVQITGSAGIGNASAPTVFTPAAPNNQNVWAPELHFLQNKWYIYFAADDGNNANHRLYVAESTSAQGTYTPKGKISDATDRWAIDGTVLQKDDGSLYLIWSGWPGTTEDRKSSSATEKSSSFIQRTLPGRTPIALVF
jgi:GH43 family beta-xylosidase